MTAQVQEFTVEARDIGTDGSLMIVIGEYDDAFLTGRVDEHYDPLDGIPYLIEETTKDIEQIMWWKLQNPPQLDENGNELETPPDLSQWWEECHSGGPYGLTASFENDLYAGVLRFETHNTWGVTEGGGERAFAEMIVSFLKDKLISIVKDDEE